MGKKVNIVIAFLVTCLISFSAIATEEAYALDSKSPSSPTSLLHLYTSHTVPPGTYTITATENDLALSTDYRFAEKDNTLVIEKTSGSILQRWKISPADENLFTITHEQTGLALTVKEDTAKTTVGLTSYTGNADQQFSVIPTGNSFCIYAPASNTCLNIEEHDGTYQLTSSVANGTESQKFSFQKPSISSNHASRISALESLESKEEITTFGDFELQSNQESNIQSTVDEAKSWGNDLGFIVMDLSNEEGFSYNVDRVFYGASTIKGPYVASLSSHDPDSISEWIEVMEITVRDSDNDAYLYLWETHGSEAIDQWAEQSHVTLDFSEGQYPWYTTRELAKLWTSNYRYFLSQSSDAQTCSSLYTSSTFSALHETLGDNYDVYSKPGWEYDYYASTNDAGIVWVNNKPYLIVIMSNIPGDASALHNLVRTFEETLQEA